MPQPSKNPIREAMITVDSDRTAQIDGERAGRPALFTCPECGGVLWQVREPEMVQFRCHVGHIIAGEHLFAEQRTAAENALWTAIRVLEDRSVLGKQLVRFARKQQDEAAARQFEIQAQKAEREYRQLRQFAERDDHPQEKQAP